MFWGAGCGGARGGDCCVEDEVDAGFEFGVGLEVSEGFGKAVDVGEAVGAEGAEVARGAVAWGLIGAGATADGEAADFPHGVAADEAEEDALGLDGCARGESGVDVGVERGFGKADGGLEAAGVEDDEGEGVGVMVAELAEFFRELEESRAGAERGRGDGHFVEEALGEAGEEFVLVGEVGVEGHGLDAEFGGESPHGEGFAAVAIDEGDGLLRDAGAGEGLASGVLLTNGHGIGED